MRPVFFADNGYIGRGISGQTSAEMLARFRPDVIELAPKTVVILAGTNDIAQNNGPIELENVMERAVILTSGKTLNLTPESLLNYTSQNSPLSVQSPVKPDIPATPVPETDKDTIIRALQETEGKIGGKTGAAARLGLKRTTLLARLRRFGINADDFRKKQD